MVNDSERFLGARGLFSSSAGAARANQETEHGTEGTIDRSERLEEGAPHGAELRVERGTTHLEGLDPPGQGTGFAAALLDHVGRQTQAAQREGGYGRLVTGHAGGGAIGGRVELSLGRARQCVWGQAFADDDLGRSGLGLGLGFTTWT